MRWPQSRKTYRTPVPVEVLVSALNVSYHEWMDAVCEKGPAWGLLYAEYLPDGTTTSYRPRNYVVTRTLVDTINGGRLGRSGEVEHLLTLFRACTGTSLVYREYCVGMLVPRTKLAHLDYADGLQLYDTALAALPLDDRTLKHQKGLWIKDKGNDPLLAKSVLESALAAKSYPYTDRVEADEHIHTSLAATILDLVDQGNADLDGTLPETSPPSGSCSLRLLFQPEGCACSSQFDVARYFTVDRAEFGGRV